MRSCAFLAVCLLFLFVSFARAEFYRWVDKDGKEFFTNEREQVPQEYRNIAAEMQPDESRVSVGEKAVVTGRSSAPFKDHKDKYGRGKNYWHKRAAKLRKELAAQQIKYDLLLKREKDGVDKRKKLNSGYSRKRMKTRARRAKRKLTLEMNIARKKHELEVELPDEARKSEAYPGWMRE